MNKLRSSVIGVLMGGRSHERDASLRSGGRVLRCLLNQGYRAAGIDLTDPRQILDLRLDVAFLATHGGEGEDGTLQTLLELAGVPYTGPGVLTSALCANRVMLKRVLAQAGVPTARFLPLSDLDGGHMDLDHVKSRFPFPIWIRPIHTHSGIAPTLVNSESEFMELVPRLKTEGAPLLAEESIPGRRLVVGILGEQVLPPLEIVRRPASSGATLGEPANGEQRHIPAVLESRLDVAVRRVARRALDAVGCTSFGLAEITLDGAAIPWVAGIRTLPSFVENSDLEVSAAAAGCRYDELIVRVLESASLKSASRPVWIEAHPEISELGKLSSPGAG